MADIISFSSKRQREEDEKHLANQKRKIAAVRQMFQCSHCASKCIKCGAPIEGESDPVIPPKPLRIPYRFCSVCSAEYIDYIEYLKGRCDSDRYWHNETWVEAWGKWIDYQSTIDRYIKSKEFVQLLDELKSTTPDL